MRSPGIGRQPPEAIMPGICKDWHWSHCNERHQFVGGGTFARSSAWRRLCSAAQHWAERSAVPLWRWPVTGSKGADWGGQRSRLQNQAATLSRRRGSPLWASLWYCSCGRPTPTPTATQTSPNSLNTRPHTHTAKHTASRPLRHWDTSLLLKKFSSGGRSCILSSGPCITGNLSLAGWWLMGTSKAKDFLSGWFAAKCCCASLYLLSAFESGPVGVGALPSCLISRQIKGAAPGLYK